MEDYSGDIGPLLWNMLVLGVSAASVFRPFLFCHGTRKNVYKPPSTVPVHQHYTFSWIEFVDACNDELDPERRWGE
jgi:hypothetical protein